MTTAIVATVAIAAAVTGFTIGSVIGYATGKADGRDEMVRDIDEYQRAKAAAARRCA